MRDPFLVPRAAVLALALFLAGGDDARAQAADAQMLALRRRAIRIDQDTVWLRSVEVETRAEQGGRATVRAFYEAGDLVLAIVRGPGASPSESRFYYEHGEPFLVRRSDAAIRGSCDSEDIFPTRGWMGECNPGSGGDPSAYAQLHAAPGVIRAARASADHYHRAVRSLASSATARADEAPAPEPAAPPPAPPPTTASAPAPTPQPDAPTEPAGAPAAAGETGSGTRLPGFSLPSFELPRIELPSVSLPEFDLAQLEDFLPSPFMLALLATGMVVVVGGGLGLRRMRSRGGPSPGFQKKPKTARAPAVRPELAALAARASESVRDLPLPPEEPVMELPLLRSKWTCSHCSTEVDDEYDTCWVCERPRNPGASAPGPEPTGSAPDPGDSLPGLDDTLPGLQDSRPDPGDSSGDSLPGLGDTLPGLTR